MNAQAFSLLVEQEQEQDLEQEHLQINKGSLCGRVPIIIWMKLFIDILYNFYKERYSLY